MVVDQAFIASVKDLVGMPVSDFSAGVNRGTRLSLDFGKREALPPRISAGRTVQPYRSEAGLFILCAWRIDDENEVRCGSLDVHDDDGPKITTLQQLVGSTITEVSVQSVGLDLAIGFSNGWTLRVFCDEVNEVDDTSNYMIETPTGVWGVGAKSILERMEAAPKP
jgi:hypothetical protein